MNIKQAESNLETAAQSQAAAGMRLSCSRDAHAKALADEKAAKSAHDLARADKTWKALLDAQLLRARRVTELQSDEQAYEQASAAVEAARSQLRMAESDEQERRNQQQRTAWIAQAKEIGTAIGTAFDNWRKLEPEVNQEVVSLGVLRAYCLAAMRRAGAAHGIRYLDYPQDETSFVGLISVLINGQMHPRSGASIEDVLAGDLPAMSTAFGHIVDDGLREQREKLDAAATRRARRERLQIELREVNQQARGAGNDLAEAARLREKGERIEAEIESTIATDKSLHLGPAITGLPA